jgi:hypothetical protein
MSRRAILVPTAIVFALACAANPGHAAEKKPWDFVKELIQKPLLKAERRLRPARPKTDAGEPAGTPASGGKDIAGAPDDAAVPIPRPRPQRETAKLRTPDFDSTFVPPPVLTIPPEMRAPRQQPAATEPEIIPLGPPDAGTERRQATFPFPVPRRKPAGLGVEPLAMLPEDQPPAVADRPAMPEIGTCATDLAALGVDASPLAPVSEGACTVAVPTSVTSFENGTVKLPIKALLNCEMAKTAARWLHDAVQPAAVASLGGRVTGLRVAASYDCRTRDHIAGAKLSEHAFGNAVDFSAFRVNDRWIEVGGDHAPQEKAFIDAIRARACGPFKTVLGPGSDRFHVDHLHLDLAKRRTAGPSKGLYCK